jgi:cellulase/cellobiase CelA1
MRATNSARGPAAAPPLNAWIEPPGESDCGDPTGALANAPHPGPRFAAGSTALVPNAYPAL